jgi:hypothetical protein
MMKKFTLTMLVISSIILCNAISDDDLRKEMLRGHTPQENTSQEEEVPQPKRLSEPETKPEPKAWMEMKVSMYNSSGQVKVRRCTECEISNEKTNDSSSFVATTLNYEWLKIGIVLGTFSYTPGAMDEEKVHEVYADFMINNSMGLLFGINIPLKFSREILAAYIDYSVNFDEDGFFQETSAGMKIKIGIFNISGGVNKLFIKRGFLQNPNGFHLGIGIDL